MSLTITDEMLKDAVDRMVADLIPADRIDALVEAAIQQRIGTVSIERLEQSWGCHRRTVLQKLAKHKIKVIQITREVTFVRLADIERLYDARGLLIPFKGKDDAHFQTSGKSKAA
jgi:hypothetical protein